ncbi:hypothetical protein OAE03_01950 [Winogradskyella sp.]|nr:hypothetical protein [Winogradskyella sp.]MDC0009303.1 hypothetical protein [Winogradskyella sp.]MDC1503961.1 hypothetical protein [Winogradskyella sp.]
MNKEYIEFRKQSDFSGILTDTFGFIRNEFKPLMKTIFNVAGPAILIFMLSLAAYNYIAGDIFDFDSFGDLSYNSGSIFATVIAAICYFISSIAAYILTTSAVLYYIKSYIDHKGETDLADIKRNAYKNFWSFFGLSFLQGLTIIISLMLCVLPFFYAMVPMAVVFSIFVFETKRSTTDAYSQAFTLVNADFWTAFGAIIVIGIIYFVGGNVFTFVASLYTMVGTGIFAGEIDPADLNSFSADPILIILTLINTFFQLLLNSIIVIGGAVIYFHLHEKTNFTGTYDRISEIGKIED